MKKILLLTLILITTLAYSKTKIGYFNLALVYSFHPLMSEFNIFDGNFSDKVYKKFKLDKEIKKSKEQNLSKLNRDIKKLKSLIETNREYINFTLDRIFNQKIKTIIEIVNKEVQNLTETNEIKKIVEKKETLIEILKEDYNLYVEDKLKILKEYENELVKLENDKKLNLVSNTIFNRIIHEKIGKDIEIALENVSKRYDVVINVDAHINEDIDYLYRDIRLKSNKDDINNLEYLNYLSSTNRKLNFNDNDKISKGYQDDETSKTLLLKWYNLRKVLAKKIELNTYRLPFMKKGSSNLNYKIINDILVKYRSSVKHRKAVLKFMQDMKI